MGTLSSPLNPDSYLELINPLWSTRELRGKVVRVEAETDEAATIYIKPGYEWIGHEPGQYLRIGVDIDGVRHWRAYSLTSEPNRPDGLISITPKLVSGGAVSPFMVRHASPGTLVQLGGVEGTFTLPSPAPDKLLFVTAGSGITPVMCMLRAMKSSSGLRDVVLLHSAPSAGETIFGRELRELESANPGLKLHVQLTSEHGRLAPQALDELCPDWREREAYHCGPIDMLDVMAAHWDAAGIPAQLHKEHFQPAVGDGEKGAGGEITFRDSKRVAACDGATPILVAGEEAGALLPFGCRMGICHTCVGYLRSGTVRDLRTGELHGEDAFIRTCVHAPEGPIEIDL